VEAIIIVFPLSHSFLRILRVLSPLLFIQFCVLNAPLLQTEFTFVLFLPVVLYFSVFLSFFLLVTNSFTVY